MSEHVNVPANADHTTNELAVAVELKKEVKTKVEDTSTNGMIRKIVVDQLVEVEVNSRGALLKESLDLRDNLFKEFNKVKPDQVQCDATGKVVQESWSKSQAKQLKESTEKLDKIDGAINKAVNKADYENLRNVLNKLKGKGGGKKDDN